jgi:hypothetical protein
MSNVDEKETGSYLPPRHQGMKENQKGKDQKSSLVFLCLSGEKMLMDFRLGGNDSTVG